MPPQHFSAVSSWGCKQLLGQALNSWGEGVIWWQFCLDHLFSVSLISASFYLVIDWLLRTMTRCHQYAGFHKVRKWFSLWNYPQLNPDTRDSILKPSQAKGQLQVSTKLHFRMFVKIIFFADQMLKQTKKSTVLNNSLSKSSKSLCIYCEPEGRPSMQQSNLLPLFPPHSLLLLTLKVFSCS